MKIINHFADLFRYLPGKIGDSVRKICYKLIFKKFGKNSEIKDGVVILFPENISIGNYSAINQQSYLNALGGIEIGNYTRIAPHVAIISSDHGFRDTNRPISMQEENSKKIVIEDDVWVGYGAIILKGVRIGKGSVISANAKITRDVKPYSVIVGNNILVAKRKRSN